MELAMDFNELKFIMYVHIVSNCGL